MPRSVQINAWPGDRSARGVLGEGAENWGARRGLPPGRKALPFGAPIDPVRWDHPEVGYGVLLPDDDTVSAKDKAVGEDAPWPVKRILHARPGTVLLRWSPSLRDGQLCRYYEDGSRQEPAIGLTKYGTAPGNWLPRYVLIAAPPDQIPWSVQYALNSAHAVGRLPFTGDALAPYVDAMLAGWPGPAVDMTSPVIWAVDHGPRDITRLMRSAITEPLSVAMTGTLPGLRHLRGTDATIANLLTECSGAAQPALVVTSSHGSTPVGNNSRLRAELGLPVDVEHVPAPLDELAAALPSGSVWFAHACCSAGGAGESAYEGLLRPGTVAHGVVTAVAALGATVAPAALRLLSRPTPVRAVIGHVEPTFSWTLQADGTGQLLGGTLVTALTSNLHHGQPLGLMLDHYRRGIGQLYGQWADLRVRLEKGDASVLETLTRLRLTAVDRQSLVLLGDPTVVLPNLASNYL